MKKILLISALFGSALMAQNGPLANGIYAVEEGSPKGQNLVTRPYEGKNVVLNTANFAPLVLDGKPQINRDGHGGSLMVQLAPDAAKRLEAFTRAQMNRPIAVVVGDRILATPRVRDVIKDGKAKVTPCEEPSCETLLRQLTK